MTPDYFIYYFRVVSYYTKVRTKLLSKVIDSPTLLAYYSYCIDALSSDGKRQGALGRTGLRRCGSRTRKGCRVTLRHVDAPEARQAERAAAQVRRARWQAAETWGRARSTLPEGGVAGLARSARQRAEEAIETCDIFRDS